MQTLNLYLSGGPSGDLTAQITEVPLKTAPSGYCEVYVGNTARPSWTWDAWVSKAGDATDKGTYSAVATGSLPITPYATNGYAQLAITVDGYTAPSLPFYVCYRSITDNKILKMQVTQALLGSLDIPRSGSTWGTGTPAITAKVEYFNGEFEDGDWVGFAWWTQSYIVLPVAQAAPAPALPGDILRLTNQAGTYSVMLTNTTGTYPVRVQT